MQEIIKNIQDFKIIPNNFKSSAKFNLLKVDEKYFYIELLLDNEKEIKDYSANSKVEIFGVNNVGLVYFETKISEQKNNMLTLELTNDYSIIQRREYSRVEPSQGKIIFLDKAEDFVTKIIDISAGGVKLISKEPLEIDRQYEINIILSNNMKIECYLQPIRITEANGQYITSGKFINLENSDRIILVQYTFKIKIEEQSRGNE